jgi:hypothetical protein
MESLPNELTKEIVSHMPYESVVYMCQTDQHFNTLCQSNNFWEQLYMRDYGVYHAKEKYILAKQALERFSKIFPIITQRVLEILINPIVVPEWNILEGLMIVDQNNWGNWSLDILSIDVLKEIVSMTDLDETPSINTHLRNYILKRLISTPNKIYPNFKQLFKELRESDCDKFRQLISQPAKIFVRTKPLLLSYDYDLAEAISINIGVKCEDEFDDIINETIDLLKN